jgi:hypothetical protein
VFRIGGGSLSLRIGSAGRAPLPLLLLTFVCTVLGAGTIAAYAQAEGCPNEQLRRQDGYALGLPDCRAYEQVSPVDKNFTDALGESDIVQSSASGDGVTFFSGAPFPGVLSATSIPLYLSTRADGEWSTQGLVPSTIPRSLSQQGNASVLSLTEDLSEAIVNTEPGLEGGMASGGYSYLRDNATGSFWLLAPGAARFADATMNDSRIIFEDTANELVPGVRDETGIPYLYEWNASRPPGQELSLAGVLPNGEAPMDGSVAGPGGPALGRHTGGSTGEFYTQDTISADGSRIFFSDVGTGQIYMREPEAARTIPVSAGIEPAYWRAATVDGSMVFYTEGEELYRFNVNKFEEGKKPELEALAEAREALTSGAAGVLGTLGIATENGSYVYFVATGVLASNENGNKEKAEVGEGNLYEWHDGETIFVALLSTEDLYDEYNWRDFYKANSVVAPATGEKSSRVTPDGKTVLFTSQKRLTAYDNAGQGELYLYGATGGRLTCVSCNPSGAPATSEAYLAGNPLSGGGESRNAFLTRNLAEDGSRVFFQTDEALVPQDTNGQADVYEWEREGAGGPDGCSRSSATFGEGSDGCLYLISTGESGNPSYFGDASASGDDVFFFTRQSLVGQDRDENYDIYDARVAGGIIAQSPLPQVGCTEEGCLDPAVSSPVLTAPSSTTFTGVGNLAPAPEGKPKSLTRAQKLARALKVCGKRSRKTRVACEARARKRYGKRPARKRYVKPATKAARSSKFAQKRDGR